MTKIILEDADNLIAALLNPLFPEVDSLLRSGYHISADKLDAHSFLTNYQDELETFYQRYHVDLIHAPESFFYLRPRASTLIARSCLSELEMMLGKILCYLYLSPERLAQEGIFSIQDLYDELMVLVDEVKLLRYANQRSAGSDLDKQKLFEKVKTALNRLRRMGIITFINYENQRFIISEAVFRFGMDVRTGEDKQQAQLRLIRDGEAVYHDEITSTPLLDEEGSEISKEFEEPQV